MADLKEIGITEGLNIVKFIVYGGVGLALLGSGMVVLFGGNFATFLTAILPQTLFEAQSFCDDVFVFF